MSERRRALIAATAAGIVLVLAFALVTVPWLLRERTFVTSTPTLRPLAALTTVRVPGGEAACLDDGVLLEPAGKAVRIQVRTIRGAAPPLVVEARGDGYRARSAPVTGYRDFATLDIPLAPPGGTILDGSLCFRNTGEAPVGIVATTEARHFAPVKATLDGQPIEPQVSVAFVDTQRHTALSALGTLADHVAAFRPAIVSRWTLYPLALLVVLGIPALVVLALWRSASGPPREPDEDAPAEPAEPVSTRSGGGT